MIAREKDQRDVAEIITIEDTVPKDHLLRKIDKAVPFFQLYSFVEDLYSTYQGRKSIDPVTLFKIILIQHIYGIPSLRQTLRDISLNLAYRWFLGYCISEPVPHFATVSHNFKHRFPSDRSQQVFGWLLEEIAKAGYLSSEAAFVDVANVKTSASLPQGLQERIMQTAKLYEESLRKEVSDSSDVEASAKGSADGSDTAL